MNNERAYEIGIRISELRRANKMTQEALADKLNVTPKHISHAERGCTSLSLSNLIKICEIFGCSLDYLVLGEFQDEAISQIPAVLVNILHSGNEDEKKRLLQYLKIYTELYLNSKKT